MIRKLSVYTTKQAVPYRNLAVEEYLTLHTEPDECILYLWQNQRSVIIGKNQNCWKECRVERLKEDGGFLVRRLSGGGAVFHDLGNLNFTFCARRENYDTARQLQVILDAVKSLGIRAEKTGRNDVTVDGRKFSGNAFYRSGDFCCHHGTLLVDVDREAMSRYLHVADSKLSSKGVASVKARTVNLKDLEPELTVPMLEQAVMEAFSAVYGVDCRPFAADRFAEETVRARTDFFSSWEWIYGRRILFHHEWERRFSWGNLELQFQVDGGIIREVEAFTDAMDEGLKERLEGLWRGCRYEPAAMAARLDRWEDGVPGEEEYGYPAVPDREICRDLRRWIREMR